MGRAGRGGVGATRRLSVGGCIRATIRIFIIGKRGAGRGGDVADSETTIDGAVFHKKVGAPAAEKHTLGVVSAAHDTTTAPNSIALVSPVVLALPPVW